MSNTHYFVEEASGLVFSCDIYECDICGEKTAAPETLEETTVEDAESEGLIKAPTGLDEGVETAFAYMCAGCAVRI